MHLAGVGDGHTIVIGDIDGDDRTDLVSGAVQSMKISVLRNLSEGGGFNANSFSPPVDFASGNWVHTVGLADFNGDAKPDIAATGELPSHLSIFQNLSAPGDLNPSSMSGPVAFASGWNAGGLAIADLDADSRPEVVFANAYDDTVTIYRNISPLAGPPLILSQPVDQTAAAGESATFSVQAAGSFDLAYQWWNTATGESRITLRNRFRHA